MLLVMLTDGMKKWVDVNEARELQKRNRIALILEEQRMPWIDQPEDTPQLHKELAIPDFL